MAKIVGDVKGVFNQDTGRLEALVAPIPGAAPIPVSGSGTPSAFTSRALTDADNGVVLVAAGAAVATVNTGRVSGFGCTFVGAGAVTFNGTATVTDYRTTGAVNPSCALIQIGTDTYGVYGSKA